MAILQKNKKSHLERNMFFDNGVDIARYDQVKYPQLEKITDKQLGFFWRPEEVDVSKDKKDFYELSEHEQHIFTSNLKRQIVLDSVQGRAPNMAFLPICSLPEVENWVETWSFFETIHSRSYTHIIRNIYPNPSDVFDHMLDIKEITTCGKDISKYYDELIADNNYATNKMDHKRSLYMCMLSANALEGIRFYVSFACSWAFAELKKMEGFPIGEDDDILNLSDPPFYTACPNPWLNDFIDEWEKVFFVFINKEKVNQKDKLFWKEFILWSLVEFKKLSKDRVAEGYQFKDTYSNFFTNI